MIEQKIDDLIASIDTLSEIIASKSFLKTEKPEETKAEKPEETKAEKPEETEITEKMLQDLCLKIVRKDRSNRKTIETLIQTHGGKLLKDIDPSDYSSLYERLKEI